MKIFLCTGADANYFNKPIFQNCLKSYSTKTKKIERRVFLVENSNVDVETFGIEKKFIPWNEINSKNTNRCIQHGEFARYLPECGDDDIIIFTDGDIVLQREFTDEEIEMIKSLPENTFYANYNYRYRSSLEDIIDPNTIGRISDFLNRHYGISRNQLTEFAEMNTGVLIGRKKDFIKLSELYNEHHQELLGIIGHFCYQQYLINVVIGKHFNYKELDYTFHSHSHHSVKNGERYTFWPERNSGVPSDLIPKDGIYHYKDTPILFAHKL